VWTTVGTSYTYLGLTCDKSYVVAVDAYDVAGNQSPQTAATVATAACPDTTAPSTPSGLAASNVTGTSLTLGWNASTDNVGVTGYDVYRNGTKMAPVTSTSSSQTGLTCGTSYNFAVVAYDAAGNRSSQAQATATTAACPSPPPPPPPPPPSGTPTLEQVDGGPNYYAQFGNPLSSASTFFPISTWGSYAHFAPELAKDKAVGINGYVWVASDAADMTRIRDAGMWAIQDYALQGTVGSETKGWMLGDEVDMQQGASACPSVMNQRKASLTNPGGRFYFSWYGKGVIFWLTDAQAACFVNYDNVNGADIYWFTDPDACTSLAQGPAFYGLSRPLTQAECRRARNYGDKVSDLRRLDAMDGVRHPIWDVIEVGCPFTQLACITPAQARAAVWHSLIAGARGIEYFQHSFSGPCQGHHVLRDNACYQPMIDTITSVNAQIKSIAPALNGPKLTSGFTANPSVRAVAKWDGSNFYVIAGSAENAASVGNFAIPCVGNATATVVGENRTLPVTAGSFSDSFADGNAIHIYRIDGGSTCGLS
jgi:Fibronectin type III domain